MLSIRFAGEREWWVSGVVFDRLIDAAREKSSAPMKLDELRHVADANGGLSVALLEPDEAVLFRESLIEAADRELARLPDPVADLSDETYRLSLGRLRALFRVDAAAG